MANKIQIKRGLVANLPALNEGEPGLCTDTQDMYIGTSAGNIKLLKENFLNVKFVGPKAQYKTINAALASITDSSISNRYLIVISPGTYNEKLILKHGIDLLGLNKSNTIITYAGTSFRADDTLFAAYDCTITNITIIQDATGNSSDLQNYPIHADGDNGAYTLKLNNVICKALGEWSHHGIGCGLRDNQNIEINNCEFHSDGKPAFYVHNMPNTSNPMRCIINNSKIYGCKTLSKTTNNCAFLAEDVGSVTLDEVIINNTEIIDFTNGGYEVILQKHPLYNGTRNTLCIKLLNCNYNNFKNETDSGAIVTDKDMRCISPLTKTDYGKPVIIANTTANIPNVNLSTYNDSEHVLGVFIPYLNAGYIRTIGITDVLCDASFGAISMFNFLSTASNGYAKLGTIGNGKCFAIALQALESGQGYIKAMLVPHI